MINTFSEYVSNPVALWRVVKDYLKVDIAVDVAESSEANAPVMVMVTATNTAPSDPDWPEIVFMGVKLEVRPEEPQQRRRRSIKQHRNGPAASSPQLEAFRTSDGSVQLEQGEALHPGQSITFECPSTHQELSTLDFHVEGTLSYHRFFRYRHAVAVPTSYTKQTVLPYLRAFNAIPLHTVLDLIVRAMSAVGPDTTLAELQSLKSSLMNSVSDIKETQRRVNELDSSNLGEHTKLHLEAVNSYLAHVETACSDMKNAVSSANPDQIEAAKATIDALMEAAAEVNRATEALLQKHEISDAEANYRFRGR